MQQQRGPYGWLIAVCVCVFVCVLHKWGHAGHYCCPPLTPCLLFSLTSMSWASYRSEPTDPPGSYNGDAEASRGRGGTVRVDFFVGTC